jgi:hypothetical protein
MIDASGCFIPNRHRRFLRGDERVMPDRCVPQHLRLIVRPVGVLDRQLDIDGLLSSGTFLRKPLIEGLAFLLLLRSRAERFTAERVIGVLDHGLEFFSRILFRVVVWVDVRG